MIQSTTVVDFFICGVYVSIASSPTSSRFSLSLSLSFLFFSCVVVLVVVVITTGNICLL
jgi:hypothetical protein